MLTASVIGNEIAVFVEVVLGIQALTTLYIVKILPVKDDAAQSIASRYRHPRTGSVSNATLIMTEFLQHICAIRT